MLSKSIDLAFFIVWLVPGLGLLPVLILALVAGRGLPCRPALASLAVTLLIAAILHSLLFFTSIFNVARIAPSDVVCGVQSAALMGVDMIISYALLGMVHTMFCAVRDARLGESYKAASQVRKPVSRLFIAAPYVSLLSLTIVTIFARFQSLPSASIYFAVNDHLPYCAPYASVNSIMDMAMFAVNGGLVFLVAAFEVAVGATFWKARQSPDAMQRLDKATFGRDAFFALTLTAVMGSRAALTPLHIHVIPDFALAAMGTVMAVTYGSQFEASRLRRASVHSNDSHEYIPVKF